MKQAYLEAFLNYYETHKKFPSADNLVKLKVGSATEIRDFMREDPEVLVLRAMQNRVMMNLYQQSLDGNVAAAKAFLDITAKQEGQTKSDNIEISVKKVKKKNEE